jgi:hypothetical protein
MSLSPAEHRVAAYLADAYPQVRQWASGMSISAVQACAEVLLDAGHDTAAQVLLGEVVPCVVVRFDRPVRSVNAWGPEDAA